MSNVGYATLSIIPSFRGVDAAIKKELGGVSGSLGSVGETAGRSFGDRFISATKSVAGAVATTVTSTLSAAGALGGALFAFSLAKGLGRLNSIEQAEAKLIGLGHTSETVTRIMNDALASVKGTAFGLDEAATVAASTVASGIKPGKDLERVLRLVGDAATISGLSLGEMGAIFNKVAASNRVSMQEINQLTDAGLPILQLLGEQYGKNTEAVRKMVTEGKVDFADFAQAIEAGMGGAALSSGDTTQGALRNVGAALSRFGAAFLKPFFKEAQGVFKGFIGVIDDMTAKVGAKMEQLTSSPGFVRFQTWLREMPSQIGPLIERLSKFGPALAGIGTAITLMGAQSLPFIGQLVAGFNPLVLGFIALIAATPELRAAFIDLVQALAPVVSLVTAQLSPVIASLLPTLKELVTVFAQSFNAVLIALLPVLPSLADSFAKIAVALAAILIAITPILPPLAELIAAFVDKIGAPVLAKIAETIALLAEKFVEWVSPLIDSGKAASLLAGIIVAKLIVALGKLAIQQGATAVATSAAWASQTVAAARASAATAVSIGQSIYLLALYAADAVKNAAKVVASWVVQSAAAAKHAALSVVHAGKVVASWVVMGVQAAAHAIVVANAWALQTSAAIKNAALHPIHSAKVVAGWVAMGGTSTTSAAKVVAAWVSTGVAAVVHGAKSAVALAGQGVKWVAMATVALVQQAPRVVAAWALTSGAAVAAAGVMVAQIAIHVAQWTFLGVQSLAHAAKVAAAWIIAMGPIAIVIAAVIALVVVIVKNWDTIRDAIVTAATFVIDWVKSNWPLLLAILTGPFGLAVLAIVRNWDTIKSGAATTVQWVKDRFNDVITFFKEAPGRIASAAVGLFDGIRNAFRSAINWVIRAWNGLEFKLPGFDPPGPGPKIPEFVLGVPNIRELAFGGRVKAFEPVIVGDAGRPELFVPDRSGYVHADASRFGGSVKIVHHNTFQGTPEEQRRQFEQMQETHDRELLRTLRAGVAS